MPENLRQLGDFSPEVWGEMPRKSSPKRKSRKARPLFEGIRKPLAPPGHPLSHAKPEEKARPSGRTAKHKRKPEISDPDSAE
ncbi:MAG: hypothetical protein ACR2HX_05485 [Pyrinomonadaceae bacterium]